MSNPWLQHVATFRESHPDLSYKQALTQAKTSYTKKKRQSKKQSGHGGQEELITQGIDAASNVIESIIGTPQLQATRTDARIARRTAADERRLEKQRAIQDRRDKKLDARLARRAR